MLAEDEEVKELCTGDAGQCGGVEAVGVAAVDTTTETTGPCEAR